MTTKEEVLKLIQIEANKNNGVPLSSKRFEENTGIKPYYWQKYWARFGDAQEEAGFRRNKFLKAQKQETILLEKFIVLMRELKKWPTKGEIVVKHHSDKSFPVDSLFYKRFGTKMAVVQKIFNYANEQKYTDIIKMCKKELKGYKQEDASIELISGKFKTGWVYLTKSGPYYKIGKTNNIERRNYEIGVRLPEGYELIYEIKTDDIDGIEAYWHKRFEEKHKRAEWFNLSTADIKAFKRWKKIT